jgi:hypothetical protein
LKKTQYVELLSWHAVEVEDVYYPEEVTDKYFLNISMYGLVWFMVLNTTFNNISVISWWSVLLVEETGISVENHRPVTSH